MTTASDTDAAPTRRQYRSTRRAQQAASTRADVLAAAISRFTESGWAGTTVNSVAAEAGVAVETIYSGFGSKKGLLRAALDVAVVGDADAVPFAEREEFHQLGRGTLAERIDAGAKVVTDVHTRVAPLWRAITEAAASDPEIDEWRIEAERGRRLDVERSLALVFGKPLDDRTVDLLWLVFSTELYLKLTIDEGLSRAEYQDVLRDAFERITAPVRGRRR